MYEDEVRGMLKVFVEKYGVQNAIDKCIEEMQELTEVLQKWRDIDKIALENKVVEEAAHVIVTVNKVLVALGLNRRATKEVGETYEHLKLLLDDPKAEEKRWRERKNG